MSEQNQANEILQLKAELYDAHKSITQQSQILSTIVQKLGIDGDVTVESIFAKIAELTEQPED